MENQTQYPTSRVALYVGIFASIVVSAVVFTIVLVYAYRHRLSSTTIRASCVREAEHANTNNPALIATTLSVLNSPRPEKAQEYRPTSNTLILSSFNISRWEQLKGAVADMQGRGLSTWTLLRERLRDKANCRSSNYVTEVEIVTPCSHPMRPPPTPDPSLQNTGDISSNCQHCLFCTPTSDDIGMI